MRYVRNGLGYSIQDTLQIIQFTGILDLDDNLILLLFSLISTRWLNLSSPFVDYPLFQNLHYMDIITYQHHEGTLRAHQNWLYDATGV